MSVQIAIFSLSIVSIEIHISHLDYVEEIYQQMINTSKEELGSACRELLKMVPPPMNTMLVKQSREEAVQKLTQRRQMVVVDVPPTAGICYRVTQT